MKRIFGMILFWCFYQSQVFAVDQSSGCGPAWYILKDVSLVSSSLRTTTDVILYPTVTIGMTFGTSNCTKHSLVENNKRSLYFLAHNRDQIASDMARGGGEYINTFGDTLGCPWQVQDHLNNALRERLSAFYQSDVDSLSLLVQTRGAIVHDPVLRGACAA